MARPRSRGSRLSKGWAGFTFDKVTLSATQQILVQFPVAEGGQDITVLRTMGNLLCSAVANAAADDDVFAFGVIVVQNAAAAVGGTSVPGPINDIDADWLWWEAVPMASIAATAAEDNSRNLVHRVQIHSKAMRRMATDQSVILVGEISTNEFAAATVNGSLRLLFGF